MATDGTEVEEQVTLKDILVFFTGAAREPPTGFTVQPKLLFVGEHLATASTCDLRLRLPVNHQTYEQFKSYFILSLKGHDGLGLA